MRDVLFRGKMLSNGEWVCGSLVKMGPAGFMHYFILPDYASAFYSIEVDPSTVGQYTGLTDKNGVKIFDGDRVRVPMYKSGLRNPILMDGTVELLNGAFSVRWDDKEYGRHFLGYLDEIEVIFNIHDNPELIAR